MWTGRDGEDAARRFVDVHRNETVVAWREPLTYIGPVHHSQVIG